MEQVFERPSRHIMDLLNELQDVERKIRPERPADEPEDKALVRLLDDRDRIVRLLATEPSFTQADRDAKLTILRARLRAELDDTDPRALTTYLLAEGVAS